MLLLYLFIAFSLAILIFINKNRFVNNIFIISFLLLQSGFTVYVCLNYKITVFEYFTADSLAVLLLITLTLISIASFFHSNLYLNRHDETIRSRNIYFSAMIILITSLSAAYLSNHIAVTWIFTELTTLSASALIYHHRNKLALEGTWKYIFICAISITFVFIGILFLSLALKNTGSTDLSFSNLVKYQKSLNIFWLKLAFLFIFTGFTAKLGLVPMFTAGIDAKDNAPAPAGALLSSVLMNVGFVGIFRFYIIISNTEISHWANLIIFIAAVLSIFIAAIYMSKVQNIKRMFAYSGIEHMGLVMLGIAAGGIGYYGAILHIILHSFVKSSLFFQFSQIYAVFRTKNIRQTGNYFKYNPIGAVVLLLGFISATAMPPSGMFISELYIFKALFQSHNILILIFVLGLLTIIIWSFSKNVMKILFLDIPNFDQTKIQKFSRLESISQFIFLFTAIWLGLNPPQVFVNLLNDVVSAMPK